MKRPRLNFLVDAAAFVGFVFLMSTGLLLRYQLPPGSGQLAARGGGPGAENRLVTLLWSWTRHDWGELHFWIAVALISVLALHLLLHWNWIVCMVRGKPSEASGWRFGLGVASVVVLTILAAAPLLAPTHRVTRQQLRAAQTERIATTADADAPNEKKEIRP